MSRKFETKSRDLAYRFAHVFSGNLVAQFIVIAGAPVLSRMFSQEDFGSYGSFSATCSLIGCFACLRFDQAVIVVKGSTVAKQLALLSVFCIFGVSVIALGVGYLLPALGFGLTESISKSLNAVYVGVAVFLMGFDSLLMACSTRAKRFKTISLACLLQAVIMLVVQVLCENYAAVGLFYGYVAGMAMKVIVQLFSFRPTSLLAYSFTDCKQAFLTHTDFPKYELPQRVFSDVSYNFPVMFFSAVFGDAVAGAYFMTFRVLQKPLSTISMAARQVFLQHAAVIHHEQPEKLFGTFRRATVAMFAIGLIPTIAIFCYGPWIFSAVLGEEWIESGHQSRWLIFWLIASMVSMPAEAITRVIRIQKQMLIFRVSETTIRMGLLVALSVFCTSLTTIAFFSFSGCVLNGILIWAVSRKLKGCKSC